MKQPPPLSPIPLTDITMGRPGWVTQTEAFFARYKHHLILLQLGMFVVFMLLLFLPLFLSEPAERDSPLDHFSVLANYMIWGLWFPLVFISVIFSGRSWCGILCPMGAASEWANKKAMSQLVVAALDRLPLT
ncbi:MAG: 4Fe-4S binding protein, partial [Halopseudomonas sp.]